ncbi:hypothetical protein ABT354_02530 [Streptomyces sp. NPDC000594]|uniref:hypothetical protein n=1 Tax=Streptomyces sp. NPDC000594 TaxID=3154261 RepID=UPI0033313F68
MRPDHMLLRDLVDGTTAIVTRPGAGRTEAEIRAAESVVGPLSPSYRWWLTTYGEGSFQRQEIATVGPPRHIAASALTEGWSGGDRLWFHQDGDCGDRYGFALDAAGGAGAGADTGDPVVRREHPVVRWDGHTGDEEPFAESFAGFLTVRTALAAGLREGPNPSMARLWRSTPGVLLTGGTVIYGPHVLRERNETHRVPAYAPHWVLIGDDGAGTGLFMRRHGRDRASVYRLGLSAVEEDIASGGELLTGDLLGWLDRCVHEGRRC